VLFESGHYTWWPKPTANAIQGAHQWLVDYIDQHGPFDAVMGFSQGCSLIGTFLLYHALETPDEPLPFKAAILICGGLPLNFLQDGLGLPVSQRAHEIHEQTVALLKEKAGRLTELAKERDKIKMGMSLWDDTAVLLHDPDCLPEEGGSDVFGLDFKAMPPQARIKIPTVHVYGAKDPRWPASIQLAYFCDKDTRKMYDHGGGHDIPRSTEVSNRLAELVVQLSKEI
jgi:pimeloyl-ACP methyl ester carboxylesterase